jgi:ferritin
MKFVKNASEDEFFSELDNKLTVLSSFDDKSEKFKQLKELLEKALKESDQETSNCLEIILNCVEKKEDLSQDELKDCVKDLKEEKEIEVTE